MTQSREELEEKISILQQENDRLKKELEEYKLLYEPLYEGAEGTTTTRSKRKAVVAAHEDDSPYEEEEQPKKKRKTSKISENDEEEPSEAELDKQIRALIKRVSSAFKPKLTKFSKDWGKEKNIQADEVISEPAFKKMMKKCNATFTGETKSVLKYEIKSEDDWSEVFPSTATSHTFRFGTNASLKYPMEATFSKKTGRGKLKGSFVHQKA
ncbi:IspH [Acrasis kona]|uniref:IspH n=1 Tax=Acrasis kona TaxID=1008807 RepID=A0AAW2ZQC1_9EUKA